MAAINTLSDRIVTAINHIWHELSSPGDHPKWRTQYDTCDVKRQKDVNARHAVIMTHDICDMQQVFVMTQRINFMSLQKFKWYKNKHRKIFSPKFDLTCKIIIVTLTFDFYVLNDPVKFFLHELLRLMYLCNKYRTRITLTRTNKNYWVFWTNLYYIWSFKSVYELFNQLEIIMIQKD